MLAVRQTQDPLLLWVTVIKLIPPSEPISFTYLASFDTCNSQFTIEVGIIICLLSLPTVLTDYARPPRRLSNFLMTSTMPDATRSPYFVSKKRKRYTYWGLTLVLSPPSALPCSLLPVWAMCPLTSYHAACFLRRFFTAFSSAGAASVQASMLYIIQYKIYLYI